MKHAALIALLIWAILVLIVIHFPPIPTTRTNVPVLEHWTPPTQPEELEA